MKYILFNQNGKPIEYAPKIKQLNDGSICFGFDNNEELLQKYRYVKYNGFRSLSQLTLVDGKIIEADIITARRTVFSKLEIRRAMRALQCQNVLNQLLQNNKQFASDWNDAQEIDLQDYMFKKAISEYGIEDNFIDKIIDQIG